MQAQFSAGNAPMLSGPPGGGKSSIVQLVAELLKRPLIDIRAAYLEAVDLHGVPSVVDGKTRWNPPGLFPEKGDAIIFFDELPNALPTTQTALLQAIQDRRIGKLVFSPDVSICAAGNRVEDRAGAGRLISSLADRFEHATLEFDLNDWVDWALGAGVASEVIAFARFRPELVSAFDASQIVSPTPRSWEKLSRVLPYAAPGASFEYEMYSGMVGEGASAEFCGFLRIYRDLPDVDAVLMAPGTSIVPEDPATLYALCGALAKKASDQNAERLITYADRLPPEFGVLLVTDSIRYDHVAMTQNRAYVKWTIKNADVIH